MTTKRVSILCAGVALAAFAPPAWAQTQPAVSAPAEAEEQSAGVGEIVVTARKVTETAQSVPLAISVLGGAELTERGIVNVQALQGQLPSIAIGEVNGTAQITSRGLGNDNFAAGSDPSVGLNVDGVVVSQPGAQLGAFFDLERVEVVRGPQGTLYGRNTTGGAINLVTNKPTADLSGYGRISYGNYNNLVLEGAVSGPISDTIRARIAFKTEDHDGWGKNVRTGKDIDDASRRAVRGTLLFLPSEKLEILLSGEYTSEKDANYQIKYLSDSFPGNAALRPPGLASSFFASNPRDINTDIDPRNDRHTYSFTGTVSYEASSALTFKSISGYRRFKNIGARDFDGTAAALANVVIPVETDQYTQEFQALVTTDRIKAVVGAYYYKENLQSDIRIGANPYGPTNALTISQFGTVGTESVAGFANVSYNLTNQLSLDLGGRWSWERREGDARFTRGGTLFPYQTAGSVKDFTPRVGLEFKPTSDVLIYASYAEGLKSGVIASGSTTPILRPERVKAYEAGVKSTLFNRTLRANLSIYRYDISDLQVSRTLPGTTAGSFVSVFENAADARAQGVELELVWRPTRAFQLSAIGGYSDATFTRFLTINPLDGPTGVVRDQAGNRLVQTPEWSSTVSAEYKADVGSGTVTTSAQAQYQSRVFFTPFAQAQTSQKPVTRFDTSIRYDADGKRWFASLWVRNLTNERVATTKYVIASGRFISGQYVPPRLWGGTVGYNF
ncbi:TonB-dependent receptor [Sphingomonas naphthae]|uniref:TonB-dependent receptor n=1 Tax=Sphingomonas naphthae TaxID=1813468 RepID=A0ABY7TTD0_9SPHN|nr:TonB-dependent receptor [Sphingomonas naphthae]WCT75129.1 TonB-dependent receptor [Sphingomonas naphthae]